MPSPTFCTVTVSLPVPPTATDAKSRPRGETAIAEAGGTGACSGNRAGVGLNGQRLVFCGGVSVCLRNRRSSSDQVRGRQNNEVALFCLPHLMEP